ncbi:MAG: hypothetical protein NC089_04070 [Bacteroides sp.]|nr:hypothetical protein [Bacteroides sp.]MCM1548571.1 hypothetical protein [Clostridium sp.]
MLGIVFCFMLFSVTVYAATVINTGRYAGHNLTCTSICEEKTGTAKTYGGVNPYNNYASVTIYGKDGKSQGTTYAIGSDTVDNAEARLPATATVRGSNLKKAVTYHALTNSNGAFLDSFLEQLVYSVDRE